MRIQGEEKEDNRRKMMTIKRENTVVDSAASSHNVY